MGAGTEGVNQKIKSFKKKYYLNLFVRGSMLSLSILFSYYLLAALLEHAFWLAPYVRFLTFFLFFAIVIICVFKFLKEPLQWWIAKKGLSEEQSARIIGAYQPSIKDRLLNLIQLTTHQNNSALAYASIQQKSTELESISFDSFIDLNENKKYLKFLVIPVVVIAGILAFNQTILTKSTDRLLHFNREYSPEAPFSFLIENQKLVAFYNEDFVLNLKLTGNAIPESAYIKIGTGRYKLENKGEGKFSYTFEKIQAPIEFQFEAAGFFSSENKLIVSNRPELTEFKIDLIFPAYIHRQKEQLQNAGNLLIPEGTIVQWSLNTVHAESGKIKFNSEASPNELQLTDNQHFSFSKQFIAPDSYEVILQNPNSSNKDKISYAIDIVKDAYPEISVSNLKDSVLYKRVMLGGIVGDDYGVSQLQLFYKVRNENQKEVGSKALTIPVNVNQLQQSFFYNWSLDSLHLSPGDHLEYFLQVSDNDAVNGKKSTRTGVYTLLMPTTENLVTEISQTQNQTKEKIDQSVGKANKLQDQIEQASQKLKGKQNLDWQDKKMLEDILQQKEGLNKMIEQLKEQNKLLEDKKDAFTEQNERIREKAEQLQKLMDELLDEETKKLFEELQKLMKENNDVSQIQKILDKLNQNSNNLEKELERSLELFKQLQFDYKLDQAVQNLKDQVDKQGSLLEKTKELENKQNGKNKAKQKDNATDENAKDPDEDKDSEELAEDQEKLNEDFKNTSEQLDELNKMSEELEKTEDLPSQEQTKEIQDDQKESQEMLKQNHPSKAKTPQQKSLQKMEQMKDQLEGAQNSMSMEMDMQNLESLRHIIHGLVKLSFDQEKLMREFSELNQNDPRFNLLAQQQLKLKDDSKILEDSLLALGKRDPFMGSIVTREVGELNDHMNKVIESNKERRRPQASSEMQASMTSINNLALMLDDHFDMMMQMMANAQPSMKKSKQKGQKPSLSQMQQQLNQKIQELKNGQKSGRQLSEELAEMAAEQERIRKALEEMQEKMNDGKAPGGHLPSKMEQTEMDLVNKQLTDQLIRRQQEILTRLLETEKSMREQDMDEERKGEAAKEHDTEVPKAFEEYLRLKEKEVELLKTVPPKLYPYYKQEVNEYFKRMAK